MRSFHGGGDSSRGPLASPWRWRQWGSPKRWHPTATLHGITTQKSSTWVYLYPMPCQVPSQRWSSTKDRGCEDVLTGQTYRTAHERWQMSMEHWWNDDWGAKPKYWERNLPSVTLFITNHTWTALGLNPSHRNDKPDSNRLNYGAVWNSWFMTYSRDLMKIILF